MLREKPVLSVRELTRDIKLILESTFEHIVVEGEVSNVRCPLSGHRYFTLKDFASQIRCVLFRQQASAIPFDIKDGMQLIVNAKVGVYERDGQYQLYINSVEPKGHGSLQLAFEQLKSKLLKEGLFDESRKKPIPFLPDTIGIITSPTGAVVRDILYVLDKRFANFKSILYPVKVQGDGAREQIVEALEYFNDNKSADIIVLARGGGSIEDLWAFNEEVVAYAIANSQIPVVCAVGHETDFTIADFVSDLRAPTPSRAAELLIPKKDELRDKIFDYQKLLSRALRDYIPQLKQQLDALVDDFKRGYRETIDSRKADLDLMISQLKAFNPLNTLKRGYSITQDKDTFETLVSIKSLKVGSRVQTKLHEGSFISKIEEINNEI